MIKLNEYLSREYMVKLQLQKSEAVTKLAADFDTTYSTVYRWLKSDDYFVLIASDKGVDYKTVYKYTAGN